VQRIRDASSFGYAASSEDRWGNNVRIEHIGVGELDRQLLDKIVFPSIVVDACCPARMSSEQMYKITRAHVKDNIDVKYAEITSDHDFCFAVSKRISVSEPCESEFSQYTKKGKRLIKEKTKRLVTDRKVKLFEMTHSGTKYGGYTIIEGIEAKDVFELKEKVDEFLASLMAVINEPVRDCPHCRGSGVVDVAVFESELLKTKAPEKGFR
jgi:hypothetical protein